MKFGVGARGTSLASSAHSGGLANSTSTANFLKNSTLTNSGVASGQTFGGHSGAFGGPQLTSSNHEEKMQALIGSFQTYDEGMDEDDARPSTLHIPEDVYEPRHSDKLSTIQLQIDGGDTAPINATPEQEGTLASNKSSKGHEPNQAPK